MPNDGAPGSSGAYDEINRRKGNYGNPLKDRKQGATLSVPGGTWALRRRVKTRYVAETARPIDRVAHPGAARTVNGCCVGPERGQYSLPLVRKRQLAIRCFGQQGGHQALQRDHADLELRQLRVRQRWDREQRFGCRAGLRAMTPHHPRFPIAKWP